MFKRATWLGVGFTLGVGTTVVAARKARQQLDRYKAPAVVERVTTTISGKASDPHGPGLRRPRRRQASRQGHAKTSSAPPAPSCEASATTTW